MEQETLFIKYEGEKPFIQATILDQRGFVRWKAVDSSIANLIKDCKNRFRGYNLQVLLPGEKL